MPGLDVVGGSDSGEVLVDDGSREPVEVKLGGDAFDGDEPLNVAGLGPSRGADFVRLLDEVCAGRWGGRSVSGMELNVATFVRVSCLEKTTVGRKTNVSGNAGGSGTVGAPSAIMRTLTVLLSGLSATNTLPGHPGMSRGSAKS